MTNPSSPEKQTCPEPKCDNGRLHTDVMRWKPCPNPIHSQVPCPDCEGEKWVCYGEHWEHTPSCLACETCNGTGAVGKPHPNTVIAGSLMGVERLAENFVIDASGCWLWTATVDKNGYGYTRWCGKTVRAHKKIYELVFGEIAPGLVLDHVVCQNPPCVNPAHLQPVTNAENIRRGRSTPLTPADITFIRGSDINNVELGKFFGVDHSTIYKIKRGKRWIAT